ncbi:rab3 GTPase-activating protein catalytic subunit [Pyrus ussuriensis x Pyrus communis]|uniref:Rab3 GTPase-activating protein catalytic subunit n=1 Tax=Pyrus ussuriensis x Pyrus communis TaxID=2448454 RepID=A0A5N5GKI3_9ROSA|nr:rab3 GTPase-activating protein catalytic subunit [Pyrus ussuriensis x Pyrus communis]
MESPSFVSKARTAFHSAAAKAERVLSDLKPDRDSDKQSPRNSIDYESPREDGESKGSHELRHLRWRPPNIGTKQDWQDRFRHIGIGKKGGEDTEKAENSSMAVHFYDENLYLLNMKNDMEAKGAEMIPSVESLVSDNIVIPPLSVMRQLATAVEAGKKSKSLKDFLASSGSSSPVRERAGLSLSAVKSLVLREKDEKPSDFCSNEKVLALIHALFDAEGSFLRRKIDSGSEAITTASLPRDIHGAPPESLVVKLAEVIGSFRTLKKMTLFWCRFVVELRRIWSEEQHVPSIPFDEIPDLNSCLLYQRLQVMNCCVSRKRRRDIATETLDFVIREASPNAEDSALSKDNPACPILYAKLSTGELVLRLGADSPSGNLTMLETGEPVYSPVTQEVPLLTEDLIKENEEFVLRTGSVGAGCSQLLSDMQAFKAANPGCILEDFVRWHSPPDWTETEPIDEAKDLFDGSDELSTRGYLSSRMQKEGNLWREFWDTSKPVPAVKQAPLFDEDLAVEGILDGFEDISPSELFQQLFVSLLGLGFVIAEAKLSASSDFSKLFYECKEYVVSTCQSSTWTEKVDELCQVYETVETMLVNPEEALRAMKQPEESMTPSGEPKGRFRRLTLNFGGKDRQLRKSGSKDQKNSKSPGSQPFSSFFDNKSSLFSKKPPKPENSSPAEKSSNTVESDWTVV